MQYKENKQKFDNVCKGYLDVINKVAGNCSVDVANPDDLDFSYTNSEEAYSVLRSLGAAL